MNAASQGPVLSAAEWRSLQALANAKYSGTTPSIPAEHLHELVKNGFAVRWAGAMAITEWGEAALAEWSRFVAGRYRTKRDGGIEYAFQVEWQVKNQVILWAATVRRAGDYAGTPAGQYHGVPQDVPSAVRGFVEAAIEKRAGVD